MDTNNLFNDHEKQPDRKWSTSTITTTAQSPTDDIKPVQSLTTWTTPPLPPIPDAPVDMASWRRRSLKRDSYASQSHQVPSAFAQTIRQNHRDSIAASWNDAPSRPQSTYRPTASRAKLAQQRAALDRGTTTWATDTDNPQNWTKSQKVMQSAAALMTAFTVALSSTVLVLITDVERDEQSLPISTAILPQAIFTVGLVFVLLTASIREVCGRKTLFTSSMLLFAAFSLIAALMPHIVAEIIMRFLAGVSASLILASVPAVLFDIYAAGQRTIPIILYAAALTIGTTIGPLLGGIAVEARSSAWAQYILLFILAANLALVCCMRESSKDTILRTRLDAGHQPYSMIRLVRSCIRPLRMLVSQPVIWLSTTCIAILTAIAFGLLQAIPVIFRGTYSFGLYPQSCVVLSLCCGFSISLVCLAIFHIYSYIPRRTAWEDSLASEIEKSIAERERPKSRQASCGPKKLRRNSAYRQSTQIRSSSAVSLCKLSEDLKQENAPSSTVNITAGLAVSIAQELNSHPANAGRHISPERLWMIASALPSFEQLLDELELKFDFVVDRDKISDIHNAWIGPRASVVLTGDTHVQLDTPQAARLAEETADAHHAAALAALEQTPSSTTATKVSMNESKLQKRSRMLPSTAILQQRPPAHWRMPLALPGAVLATGGLFILGWTASAQIHWIVPVIGLAAFGCGGFLTSVCICLYLTDRYGAADIVSALTVISAISYLLSFASTMFTKPMYESIGIGWGTSVFGFCSIITWLAPLIMMTDCLATE